MGCEGKGRVMDDSRVSGLRNEEDGVGGGWGAGGGGWLGHLALISLMDVPVGISRRKLDFWLEFRGEAKAADEDL